MNKLILSIAVVVTATSIVTNTAYAENRNFTREDFTTAAASTVNGVVSVKSYATPQMRQMPQMNDFFDDPFFDFFFGQPSTPRRQEKPKSQEAPQQRQIGLGSGVIIDADGYIVTNNHVVEDAERLEVTLNDNRNFTATVIGTDPLTDLALIKIDAPDLHVIPVGDSENLKVGEWVLAVGNPFGFTSSVTAGIVSAKARNISSVAGSQGKGGIESYIQTDAAVNQGNSGGALVNLDGELVGINTAIYSRDGSYVGCSFAIPTSIVSKVIDDLRHYGTVQRAYLGIRFMELTPEVIKEKDIKGVVSGILVAEVEERSAAREAGIEEGDVIVGINGHPTMTTAQMQEIMARQSPGAQVVVTLMRNGEMINRNVTLRNRQGDVSLTDAGSDNDFGCEIRELTAEECEDYGVKGGIMVDKVGKGIFDTAGIKSGTVILSVNGTPVRKASDIEKIYKGIISSDDDRVMVIKALTPAQKTAYYAVNF